MDEKKIAILVNPAAGKGRAAAIAEKVALKLRNEGVTMESYFIEWPPSFTAFTDVFLIGGDGTLNFFINKYHDCSIPISLFAAGSGNDFAWKLNGKRSWEESFEIALHGKIVAVDAGTCNGRFFINGVGIGFDGQVVKSMGRRRFISAGHVAYLATVLKEILFFNSIPVRIHCNGIGSAANIFMMSIANGSRYGGGFLVAPNAMINDGSLDVVTVNRLGLVARLRYLPAIEKGKHMHLPFMHSTRCTTVQVECDKIIPGHLDGELLEASTFDIRILAEHFRFRVQQNQ